MTRSRDRTTLGASRRIPGYSGGRGLSPSTSRHLTCGRTAVSSEAVAPSPSRGEVISMTKRMVARLGALLAGIAGLVLAGGGSWSIK